ncbi:MAG: AAA family ATPase [Pyrinomonadaceae bacterium]
MADGKFTTVTTSKRLRKVNEIIMSVKHLKPPEKLFDDFWCEGELALLFGPQGTGKSILAVQVAEAIARGRAIDGFVMTERRHKVLYVDLKLSERQFGMRYANEGKQYKLSENLSHDTPPLNKPLCEWLRSVISENGFRVVVIDDLSAIRQTYDGTRETLKLMRELRQLKDELDVSVLVLAGSREQCRGELISEVHMMRSLVLCDAADSVFALGVHAGNPQWRYLVQTRSQSAAIKWNVDNVPMCLIKRSDDGFLGFSFDERFVAEVDEETRQSICNVKWRRDAGASYREIADELGIAKSTVFRLNKKWTADLEKDLVVEQVEKEISPQINADNADQEKKSDLLDLPDPRHPRLSAANNSFSYPINISAIPFAAALRRIHVTDLKRGFDGYGREIFIEKEDEYTGKPIIWYNYDSKKRVRRFERDVAGILVKMVEGPLMRSSCVVGDI